MMMMRRFVVGPVSISSSSSWPSSRRLARGGSHSHNLWRRQWWLSWITTILIIIIFNNLSYCCTGADDVLVRTSSNNNDNRNIINVLNFGAKGDGKTDDTIAIRKALLHAHQQNNKQDEKEDEEKEDEMMMMMMTTNNNRHNRIIIWFPSNHIYLSQPLNITSSYTTLIIDGILKSIMNDTMIEKEDNPIWPKLPPLINYNTSEDLNLYYQYQSFIYAVNVHHIRIIGNGIIDGNGPYWWNIFNNHKSLLHAGRPNLLQFVNCTFIEIATLTFLNSPFWCIHPVLSKYIYIHHITIHARTYAPNSDGIDPDSCQHVVIEYNDIGCGDDHIAIKSGRCGSGSNGDPRDHHLHCATDKRFHNGIFETNNITIRHNTFRNGMGIAIGSESSGSIRNVEIYNNSIGVCQPGGDCATTTTSTVTTTNTSSSSSSSYHSFVDDDDSKCCGWSPALHLKTTLSRGGTIENISFHDNIVYNTSSFILLSSHYQTKEDNIPKGYDPVLVRNVSFIRNQALGNGIGGGIGATFDCSQHDVCHDIRVIDNYIASGGGGDDGDGTNIKTRHTRNPWTCHYIDTFTVYGNYPDGLQECMEQSMNSTFQIMDAIMT